MINVIVHGEISNPIRFALQELKKTLASEDAKNRLVIRLIHHRLLNEQHYHIRRAAGEITVEAGSDSGFMYALLYLDKWIAHKGSAETLPETNAAPFILKRGIKLNIPLDARTPSYSDSSDSALLNIADMWDYAFWTEFIDRMAYNHYNVLSLWSLSPFPSLVRIPEFPQTALEDVKRTEKPVRATLEGNNMFVPDMLDSLVTVKKMTMDEKIAHWRDVMRYAHDRCVEIYLFTWNIFVYGTELSGYGIDCNQDNPATREYFYCGTKALLETYPLLAGIGVTSGENMRMNDSDIDFIKATYGKAVTEHLEEHPERKFRFIHRMQMTRYQSIMKEFREFPCPFDISFKYSQAHMYSYEKPVFIDSFLKEKEEPVKIWLTVRNDDFYMFRWGDPDFARAYIKNMPADHMRGFYMGADGYTWGRDYMDLRDLSHPLFMDKMWYMFMIWGWLSYYDDLPREFFVEELGIHFHRDCSLVFETWREASAIIPVVNCVHWHDYDFQWYPEGCCMYHRAPEDTVVFADIGEFMECGSQPGSRYYSVGEYSRIVSAGGTLTKRTPLEAADELRAHALFVQNHLAGVKSLAEGNEELLHTADDMEALSYLGFYYSMKLRAAVCLHLYQCGCRMENKEAIVCLLEEASFYWKKYSRKVKEMYKPQILTRLGYVDLSHFNKMARLDVLLANKLLERKVV